MQHSPFAPPQINPVMPSLMLSACEQAGDGIRPGSTADTMRSWAASAVQAQTAPCLVPVVVSCDVVLYVDEPNEQVEAAINSVLSQDRAFPVLHLIADGPEAQTTVGPYATRSGIQIHRFEEPCGLWKAVHKVLPEFRTPWFAIQTVNSVSEPQRLYSSITQLREEIGDIFAASSATGESVAVSRMPNDLEYSPSLQLSTLVMRRSSFVDIGGFDFDRDDAGEEFFHRAWCEGRTVCISDECLATETAVGAPTLGEAPEYLQTSRELREAFEADPPKTNPLNPRLRTDWDRPRLNQFGSGLQKSRHVACDVVLPFRDDFDYVREAMEGLLQQADADIVIHLIDDDSKASPDDLFDEFRQLPNVRLYRNERNLGPFATFNNVSEFAETPFIAVQDADDISLPNRIHTLVSLLENSAADMAASATELFGQPELIPQIAHAALRKKDGSLRFTRQSRYPCRRGRGYFLENPTLTMRLETFRRLGGYADYGESRRNRTGVDTELQQRAFFSHANIAVTRDVLLKYRCHGKSATNDDASGFGSRAQSESQVETRRRLLHYATGSFDPRSFGALGQHFGITKRL